MFDMIINAIINPQKIWSRSEVLSKPSPIEKKPGVYAWYFKMIPPKINAEGCIIVKELTLLYIGISPSREKKRAKYL